MADLVVAARAGDSAAAGELVRRFERYAMAYAATLLDGDVHLARDASQEAFLEALACLSQLDAPAAFAGWLRPIVRKRADRIRRRRRERLVATVSPHDRQPDRRSAEPHDAAEARERAAAVRAALQHAAPNDRAVLGLHYLAGWSYRDIAEALDLPMSTVRKRLHDARRRFAALVESAPAAAPTSMAEAVTFLAALRSADLHTVAHLLAADRTLTSLVEPEDRILHRGHLLPVRPGYRPLHRAAATDEEHLLRLLLDYGADPQVNSDDGETPLHTAALYGRVDAVDLLLRAGADPRAVTDGGLTPRHWALIRGHADAAALLHDPHDHRPLPWIPTTSDERNSAMPPDPTSMLGRVLTTDGAPLDDGDPVAPPTTDRPLLAAASERLPTGIRVIDVCAPIVRGGTVTIAGQEGLGQLVVVAEIVQQLSRHGGASVQCGIARLPIGAATDLRDGIAPMGLQDHVAVLLADADAGPAEHERLVQQAIAAAHTLAEDRDVLLLVDRSLLPDMQTATRAAGVTPNGTVTVAILDLDPAVEDASSAQAPHEADTLLVFDEALAAANVLPAISPSRSTSRIITSATDEDAEHVSAANAVRQAANTTQRLHDFIRQPFHVAEPWTGRPGQSTGLEEAVRQAHTVK